MTTAVGAAPGAPVAPATDGGKQAVPPVKRTPGGAPPGPGPVVEHRGQAPTPESKAGGAPGAHSSSTEPPAKGTPSKTPAPKPANPDPTKNANPDWWKKFDIKLGDKGTRTLEFDSPEHFQAWAQRTEAQNIAWQQKHGQIESSTKALLAAGQDPIAAAKVLNKDFDPDGWAKQRALELYEAEQAKIADPHKWELEQRDAEIQKYKDAETQRKNAELAEADKLSREAGRKRWQQRIGEAIDELVSEEGGQPEDADYKATVLLPAIASVMNQARKMNPMNLPSGQENPNYDPDLELTPKEVAREVRRLHGRTFERGLTRAPLDKLMPVAGKHLDGLDDSSLLAKLGPERVARIVKAHLESTNPMNTPRPVAPAADAPTDEAEARGAGRTSAIGERKIPRL